MNDLFVGAYVSWDGIADRRYGCVMSLDATEDYGWHGRDNVEVCASNGTFPIDPGVLRLEPDLRDPIAADQQSIFGEGTKPCTSAGCNRPTAIES